EADFRGEDGTFHIGLRKLAECAGIGKSTVEEQLPKLHAMGFLSRIDPGIPGDGSKISATYRWHYEPTAEAVWADADERYGVAAKLLPTIVVPDELTDKSSLEAVAKAMLAIREASDPGPFGASFSSVARLAGLGGDVMAAKKWLGVLNAIGYVT